VEVITDNKKLSEEVSTLILTVRPQDMGVVLKDIENFDGILITFAAGLPISYYKQRLPHALVVRGMSNLGVAHQKGMSGWVVGDVITPEDAIYLNSLFSTLGKDIHYLSSEESVLDIVTALSGSGIGYLAYIFNILHQWGTSHGLSIRDSEEIVVGAIESLLEVYQENEWTLEEIVSQVASEGGTTEAGLQEMESNGLSSSIFKGLDKTLLKCKDISTDI
jgi:pyrroline-5-carboxylate reductase